MPAGCRCCFSEAFCSAGLTNAHVSFAWPVTGKRVRSKANSIEFNCSYLKQQECRPLRKTCKQRCNAARNVEPRAPLAEPDEPAPSTPWCQPSRAWKREGGLKNLSRALEGCRKVRQQLSEHWCKLRPHNFSKLPIGTALPLQGDEASQLDISMPRAHAADSAPCKSESVKGPKDACIQQLDKSSRDAP
eukprot:1471683-Amphidinium_carterae.1